MRIAMARLLDKIPTVMKIMEKKTESRVSVWQVVFERSPAAGDTGCLELFMDIVVEINAGCSSHRPLRRVQAGRPGICSIKTEEWSPCRTAPPTFKSEGPQPWGRNQMHLTYHKRGCVILKAWGPKFPFQGKEAAKSELPWLTSLWVCKVTNKMRFKPNQVVKGLRVYINS